MIDRLISQNTQVMLGKWHRIPLIADPFGPILVLGPRQSRKTTGLAIPALLEWRGPAVVTTASPDIVEQTLTARQAVGYAAAYDPGNTLPFEVDEINWNPLDRSRTWDDAQVMAGVMLLSGGRRTIAPPTWYDGGFELLATHLFAAAANGYTMADVIRWLETQEEFEVRSLLQATGQDAAIRAADAHWSRENVLRSGIYAETTISLSIWLRESVQRSALSDGFRFEPQNFFDGRANTIYICVPPESRHEYRALTTTFAWTVIRSAYEQNRGFASSVLGLHGPRAAFNASRGEVLPVLVVLDDAGSVAPIPDLPGLLSTGEKSAIQFITIFNDISQIQAVYGEANARSIANNHATVMVLPGSYDSETAAWVDQWLDGSHLEHGGGAGTTSETIRRLPWGKALCIAGNREPEIIDLRSSMTDRGLLGLRGLRGSKKSWRDRSQER